MHRLVHENQLFVPLISESLLGLLAWDNQRF